ncbi:MAG TPA: hypothetical protein VF867_18780 [Arthrobacter sp.]
MEIFYGQVRTLEQFFSYGPDGRLKFKPFNIAYGTVHPTAGPGTGIDDVELLLNDGEFFQFWDYNDGYTGHPSENFLDYRHAYGSARTAGDYGAAQIYIIGPDGFEDVTALTADGTKVIMGQNTKWRRTSIQERIRFINRPATGPESATVL